MVTTVRRLMKDVQTPATLVMKLFYVNITNVILIYAHEFCVIKCSFYIHKVYIYIQFKDITSFRFN